MINWEEAPEGTTHGDSGIGDEHRFAWWGRWRKITENAVYYYMDGEWQERKGVGVKEYVNKNPHLVPIPKEPPLPNGLQWPEGFVGYSPIVGGFFFREEGYAFANDMERFYRWDKADYALYMIDNRTIHRGILVAGKQEEPQAVKRQPVGWWK